MGWLAMFGAFFVVGAIGVFINVNRLRFDGRVAREVRDLVGHAPVARYRELAVGGRAAVHTLHLHHRGTFRLSPTGKDLPIDGTQVFTADPPGFVWTGRVHVLPGLWVDARDMYVDGAGSMRVLIDDTVRIADAHGPQLDQGSALRALAEMVWHPTALFDARLGWSTRWTTIKSRQRLFGINTARPWMRPSARVCSTAAASSSGCRTMSAASLPRCARPRTSKMSRVVAPYGRIVVTPHFGCPTGGASAIIENLPAPSPTTTTAP